MFGNTRSSGRLWHQPRTTGDEHICLTCQNSVRARRSHALRLISTPSRSLRQACLPRPSSPASRYLRERPPRPVLLGINQHPRRPRDLRSFRSDPPVVVTPEVNGSLETDDIAVSTKYLGHEAFHCTFRLACKLAQTWKQALLTFVAGIQLLTSDNGLVAPTGSIVPQAASRRRRASGAEGSYPGQDGLTGLKSTTDKNEASFDQVSWAEARVRARLLYRASNTLSSSRLLNPPGPNTTPSTN
ncbi:uncharacterized protein BDZ83DRAFT_237251 [Colletotrichum acutatum]|uniref:Uncharacterized protein n=1 Tax=Glomerella acutata TaxID=27357 RepID=A0AAD8USA5_GLOAC|nr:uncharacterized protein BDZ83DRAFT_237251 [Colletotrichum acutatum]KAK1726818.1 hypothetical protein BDZ83DRAFT_237251 [Colletotrichum acutatum]